MLTFQPLNCSHNWSGITHNTTDATPQQPLQYTYKSNGLTNLIVTLTLIHDTFLAFLVSAAASD